MHSYNGTQFRNPNHNQKINGGVGKSFRSVLYYCNWSVYARSHFPKDIPSSRISHVLYAFANIRPDNGNVFLSDQFADKNIILDGDDWTNSSTILKGGWTYSGGLSEATCLPERRKNFATSAVKLLKELGLDGLDVDWEYPENWDQAYQYVELLRELRTELDAYSKRLGLPIDQFELTVAAPAGPVQYHQMAIRAMDPFLSFWNLMCYDYAGSWSSTSQYHSNLYNGELSTDKAIKFYINAGVHPSKIVLGMPLYGRAFPNTDGLGRPYSGEFVGSYETDTWDYKSIPREGEKLDSSAMAVYKYDERTRMLITYDNEVVSKAKADYVVKNGLGGGMWWESSADMPITSNQSLIGTFTNQIGLEKLDKRKNCLFYPESPYQNLRNITA